MMVEQKTKKNYIIFTLHLQTRFSIVKILLNENPIVDLEILLRILFFLSK